MRVSVAGKHDRATFLSTSQVAPVVKSSRSPSFYNQRHSPSKHLYVYIIDNATYTTT